MRFSPLIIMFAVMALLPEMADAATIKLLGCDLGGSYQITTAGATYIPETSPPYDFIDYNSESCLTIRANNVIIDGQGYELNYSVWAGSNGHAFNNSGGFDNITIKNWRIYQPNGTTGSGSFAIWGIGMANSTIFNNTIQTAQNSAYAIDLESSSNGNNISGNTITTTGQSGWGVSFIDSSSNTISNNTITTAGYIGKGILFSSGASNNVLNNVIRTSSSVGYAYTIDITNSNSNNISNNDLYTTGVSNPVIHASSSSSNIISNNKINSTVSWDGIGIYFESSNSNNITSNNITTSGATDSFGILFQTASSNIISGNKISSDKDYDTGIVLDMSSATNTISNNNITTSGNHAYGTFIGGSSSGNTLLNNLLSTSGNTAYGIWLDAATNNNITGGSITAQNSYDYYLNSAGATNNFTSTNFTSSRKVWLNDVASVFNYNNQTSGNIWLDTNMSVASQYLTRTLSSWSNTLLNWNETGSVAGITAKYSILGLSATTNYTIINTTSSGSTSQILTTDSSGALPSFTIALNGNTQIQLSADTTVVITVLSPVASHAYGQKWVWANVSLNKAGSWCGVSLNGTANQTLSNTSTTAWYLNLSVPSEGSNNVVFSCNSTFGNMSTTSATTFTIDTIAPASISFVTPTEADGANKSQNFYYANVTFTEANPNTCLLNVGGANYTMTRSGTNCYLNRTGQADGSYSYKVFVNDSAGNIGTSATRTVRLDTAAPTTTDNIPATWQNGNIAVTLTPSDSGSLVQFTSYKIGAGVWTNGTTFTVSTEGNNTVQYYSVDYAGNTEATHIAYALVDKSAPTYSNLNLNNTSPKKNEWVLFSALWQDLVSGLSSYIFSWNATTTTTLTNYSDGNAVISRPANLAGSYTYIETLNPINHTGTIRKWNYYGWGTGTIKLKIFRNNGTHYNLIGEGATTSIVAGIQTVTENIAGVQSGDFIGFYTNNNNGGVSATASDSHLYAGGDVTTNTTNASWTSEVFLSSINVTVEVSSSQIVWTNDTAVAFSGNWSNITKQATLPKNTVAGWRIYANDSAGNWNDTGIQTFTVANTPPVVTASISPSPAQITDTLNCTHTYSDIDSDGETDYWFRWYVNNTLSAFTTQQLGVGNYSANDNVICSVKASDGTDNSTWTNSSTLTVGDTTPPALHGDSISASSGYTNSPFTMYVNATEANSMDWVRMELEDPNQIKTNYTMAQLSHVGNEYRYSVSATPLTAGTYHFIFYARDGSGNLGNLTSNLTYSASVYVAPTPSGGGGGSTVVNISEPNVNFALYQYGGKYIANLPLQIIDCGYGGVSRSYRISIENRDVIPFTPKFKVDEGLAGVASIVYSGKEIPTSGVTDFTISLAYPTTAKIGDTYKGGIFVSAGQTTQKIDAKFTISKFCIAGASSNGIVSWFSRGFFSKIAEIPSSKGFPTLDIYLGYVGAIATIIFLRKFPDKKLGGVAIFLAFIAMGNELAGGLF